MKNIILTSMLCMISCYARAQTYHSITHTSGTRNIHGASVTVDKTGKPRAGGGTCGVNDYWIGYENNDSYIFTFDKPVNKLRVRLTVINVGEVIKFYLNGAYYPLKQEDVTSFNGDCNNIPIADIVDGNIGSSHNYSNVEITLAASQIQSLEIEHVNGIKGGAGSIFDIAIVDDGLTAGAGNGLGAGTTGINNIALQTGMFYMQPNPAEKIVNLAFLPSSSGMATVVVTDMAGRKVLVQSYDCNKGVANYSQLDVGRFVPGNYMVELSLNEEHYIEKLVKL